MNLQQWNEVLWQYIRKNYHSGQLIYLAFDKNTLASLYPASGDDQIALEDLHGVCRKYFVSDKVKSRYSLLEEVFAVDEHGCSLILPFAVQQIIVAEEMVAGSEHSADAYYLHYCKVISDKITNFHICPLEYEAFGLIWSTLKAELICQLNATEQQITFKKGAGSKDKYRNLPISQALLNVNDLNMLCQNLTNRDFKLADGLLYKIRQLSSQLSARGKQKVHLDRLSEPVLEQLRNYYPTYVGSLYAETVFEHEQKGEFFIAIETESWSENYVLHYRIGERLYDGLMYKELKSHFTTKQLMIFVSDGWGSFLQQGSLATDRVNKEALVLYQLVDEAQIKGLFKSYHTVNAVLPEGFGLIQITEFIQHIPLPVNSNTLSFTGGMVVNKRIQQYLLGYPPTAIEYNQESLADNIVVTINGEKKTIAEFLQKIKGVRVSMYYVVEYENISITLALVATKTDRNQTKIGYLLDNGYPVKAPVNIVDNSAQSYSCLGWQSNDIQLLSGYNAKKLNRLLATNKKKWEIAAKEELVMAKRLIEVLIDDISICEQLICKIKYTNKLPAELLQYIRQYKKITSNTPIGRR